MRGYNAQGLMRDPAAVAVAKRYIYNLFAKSATTPKIDKDDFDRAAGRKTRQRFDSPD